MSQRSNPPMPARPFGFVLVEGGDELGVCAAVAGEQVWGDILCWNAQGRDKLAMLANPTLRFHQAFSTSCGIDPSHAAFDPLRRFLASL